MIGRFSPLVKKKAVAQMGGRLYLYSLLAHLAHTFTAEMITYYYRTLEEALKKAKAAGKRPGCWYGGIVLRSGRRGFAVYRDGKVVEQYTAIGRD